MALTKGQKIEVVVKRHNQDIVISGTVSDTRKLFGRTEYLISIGKATDFWVSDVAVRK